MIRVILLLAVILGAGLAMPAQAAPPSREQAQLQLDRLWSVMEFDDIIAIFQQEAETEARAIADDFIRGDPGPWMDSVARIHAPDRLRALLRQEFHHALQTVNAAQTDAALHFYDSALGRRVIGLETSTRRAMLDPDIDDQARAQVALADLTNAPRLAQIRALIDAADLVDANTASAMNSSIAFSRGLARGGAQDMPLTLEQLLNDTWAQRADIETQARDWLTAYFMLAYSPLDDAELDQIIAFAETADSRALMDALFMGYDAVFTRLSFDMGMAAAVHMQGQDL
ncbi:hypothetical protein [Paracoccus sp. (in: a-proteobacteria)]|uniref:hypothetical protein n=1 Tax=Paracoccus sp. TaxID=267 RepID=UPI0026DF60FF|nr:hypothetical protein [Paracoccus sp. (in: a-proteobacteria)]MDO5648436.1 hypothetical protein [Paracoccus sp. (in: a-proteobacteria)]